MAKAASGGKAIKEGWLGEEEEEKGAGKRAITYQVCFTSACSVTAILMTTTQRAIALL